MKLIFAAYAITTQANASFGTTKSNPRLSAYPCIAKNHDEEALLQDRPSLFIRGGSLSKDDETDKKDSGNRASANNNSSSKKKRRRRKQRNHQSSEKDGCTSNETSAREDDLKDSSTSRNKNTTKIKEAQDDRTPPPPPPPPPPQDWKKTTSQEGSNVKQASAGNNATKTTPNSNEKIVKMILDAKDLYEILDIDKSKKSTLTPTQITKAYRRRAVLTHPDKLGGDRRAFDKVSEAYDVLSDESKRRIYDRYGLEAVNDPDFAMSGGGSSFQDQIFRSFFGSGGTPGGSFSSRMANQFRKNSDMRYELEVSLEDMYRGVSHDIEISQPNGPKKVQVDIPAGTTPGSSIRLSGMVDHVTTAEPGDVVFMIKQRKHKIFTRKGYDLAMEVKITLSEAICGFQRQFVHLDGRNIDIASPKAAGKDATKSPVLIRTGDVHVLKGEGMPKEGSSGLSWVDEEEYEQERLESFGDLYVQYVVEMPSSDKAHNLTGEERKMLGILLDKMQGVEGRRDDATVDTTNTRRLRRALASDFGRASGTPKFHKDDDEHIPGQEEHFSRNGFQYFSSSSGRGQHFFSRSGSPFPNFPGGMNADDGDVQCQQM